MCVNINTYRQMTTHFAVGTTVLIKILVLFERQLISRKPFSRAEWFVEPRPGGPYCKSV